MYIMNKVQIIKEIDELIKHLQQPAINTKQLTSRLESLKGMIE